MDEKIRLAAEFWGRSKNADKPLGWLEHPTCRRLINQHATGDADLNVMEYFRRRYFPSTPEVALSLGCGFGAFDRMAVRSKFAKKIHAYDISTEAINQARIAAEREGLSDQIEYGIADLNTIKLPMHTYDAIFAIASAHHVFHLEDLFEQVRNALKPGALFILDEYVGPSRFQSSPIVVEVINRILAALPKRYRSNLFADDGSFINTYVPPPISWFDNNDPSEAVRSSEIVSTLRLYFDILEYKPYGGGILHMLLAGIAGNFNSENDADTCVLTLLSLLDELLERADLIESDMAAVVCRAK